MRPFGVSKRTRDVSGMAHAPPEPRTFQATRANARERVACLRIPCWGATPIRAEAPGGLTRTTRQLKGNGSGVVSDLLEPYEGQPSCTVLRGGSGGDAAPLPDQIPFEGPPPVPPGSGRGPQASSP